MSDDPEIPEDNIEVCPCGFNIEVCGDKQECGACRQDEEDSCDRDEDAWLDEQDRLNEPDDPLGDWHGRNE